MNKTSLWKILLLVLIIFWGGIIRAQVPNMINIQGVLRNVAGEIVSGTYKITFSLYQAESGGVPLFQQTQDVIVMSGFFNVYIGPISQDLFANNPNLYLGIKIGSDPELPRRPFTSTGYAMFSAKAKMAQDVECIGCISGSEIVTPLVINGMIQSTSGGFKFPDGTVQTTAASGGYWVLSGTNIYNTNTGGVGIGTSNPGTKLHISGGTIKQETSGGWNWFEVNRGGGDQIFFGSDDTNRGIWSGGTRSFAIYTDATPRLWIQQGSGNVGIGTASPVSLVDSGPMLHIRGTGTKGGEVVVSDINNGRYLALFSGSSQYNAPPTIAYSNSYPLILGTWSNIDGSGGFNEKMRIDTSGNVGIGTTSPKEKLEVAGIIYSSSGGFKFPDGTVQTTAGGVGVWAVSGLNIYNTNIGNVGIGTSSPVNLADSGPMLHIKGAGTKGGEVVVSDTDNNRYLALFSGSSQYGASPTIAYSNSYPLIIGTWSNINGSGGFNEKMRIDTSGNVGIGTTSPQGRLDVSGGHIYMGIPIPPTGTPQSVLRIKNEWQVGYTDLIQVGFYYTGTIGDGTTRIHSWRRSNTISSPENCPGKDPNLSPYDPNACYQYGLNYLDISRENVYTPKAFVVGMNAEVGTKQTHSNVRVHGWDAVYSSFDTGDGVNRNFHVIGTYHGWDSYGIYLAGYNYYNTNGWANAKKIYMGGGGTERMTVDLGSGNVGIGTTNPEVKLDVAGPTRVHGWDAVYLSLDTGGGVNRAFHVIGTYHGWDPYGIYLAGYNFYNSGGSANAKKIYMGGGGTERMTVDLGTGNVGIGTTTPSARLDVVGNEAFYQDFSNAQILAEAICTALRPSSGWTFAIRRECSDTAPSCAEVCASIWEGQAGWLKCFNALHIYGNQPHSSPYQIGLKTYRYDSCSGKYCGPNYCCCGN